MQFQLSLGRLLTEVVVSWGVSAGTPARIVLKIVMKFNELFQVIDLNFNINDFIRNKDISPIKSQGQAHLSRMKVHYLHT